ncbi:MAG: hypothetical protein JWM98_2649 [Thermoleophilia bacterium]|nr:hypothetical protein [Thermoleophilia bacterium]
MPRSRATAASSSLLLALLVASSLLVAACGTQERSGKGDSKKAVDTTKEAAKPADQPDPDVEVVPGSGIAGVKVGDSAADVERVLGKTDDSDPATTNELSGQSERRLRFRGGKLEVLLGEDVSQVETTLSQSQTDAGVGIGSSMKDVTTAYADATCDPSGEIRICRVGSDDAGAVATDFFVQGDKVTRIVVGRVVD